MIVSCPKTIGSPVLGKEPYRVHREYRGEHTMGAAGNCALTGHKHNTELHGLAPIAPYTALAHASHARHVPKTSGLGYILLRPFVQGHRFG